MISIIIPALNEEKALPATLGSLFSQPGEHEVIVVDGGSRDRTREIALNWPRVKLINSKRGRSVQMNAGARVAKGEWLLFLHADTSLSENALAAIETLLPQGKIQSGCFRHKFSGKHWLLHFISWMHNWRFRITRIIYGDQAMFIRRQLFEELGGFPEQPILEDVLISEKLIKVTKPILLSESYVITDSRKFVQRGICRSFFEVLVILTCHRLRLPVLMRDFFSPVR